MKAFFVSIPHSGEIVPTDAEWLLGLPEPILMCDVDRYVDRLYKEAIQRVGCPVVIAEVHRYVVDLNRLADDIDLDSVQGAPAATGKIMQGLHWVKTTQGQPLLKQPMTMAKHLELVKKYFRPFHAQVERIYEDFRQKGNKKVYHLDAHSMPSMGTKAHRDPGQKRADIVVSDCEGKSCETSFKDLVIKAYTEAGFQVAYNWPYVGGGVTQSYGRPELGQHAIQVELNRGLYMNETTKQWNDRAASQVARKISAALSFIEKELANPK